MKCAKVEIMMLGYKCVIIGVDVEIYQVINISNNNRYTFFFSLVESMLLWNVLIKSII